MQFDIIKMQSGERLSQICNSGCNFKLSDLPTAASREVSTRLPRCRLTEASKRSQREGKTIPSSLCCWWQCLKILSLTWSRTYDFFFFFSHDYDSLIGAAWNCFPFAVNSIKFDYALPRSVSAHLTIVNMGKETAQISSHVGWVSAPASDTIWKPTSHW